MAENKKISVVCQEGICPLCGGEIEYDGAKEVDDSGFTIPWTCSKCNATGKEGYTESFDGMHYNVQDEEGNDYDIESPSSPTMPALSLAQIIAALPQSSEHPDNQWSNYFWTSGEEILCRTKEMCSAVADFLDAMGLSVVTGYYDPIEDKLDGCEDTMTGWHYIK